MDESRITLVGVGAYYPQWKQEFLEILQSKTPGPFQQNGDQVLFTDQKSNCELNLEHITPDLSIHLFVARRHETGKTACCAFVFLLMILLLIVGGWRFLLLDTSLLAFFLFAVIIVAISYNRDQPNVKKFVEAIAQEAWQRVQVELNRQQLFAQEQPHGYQSSQRPVGKIFPQSTNPAASYRLPDEDYLLSPEAARIAAIPSQPGQKKSVTKPEIAEYCPHCGFRRQPGASFCANCGSTLTI
jgi:hypothetical protein